MQTKQPKRHTESTEVIEYIRQVGWSPPNSITFDEVDEELMDQLVDRRIHAKHS